MTGAVSFSRGGGGPGSDTDAIHDNVASEISAIAEKVTPVGADLLVIEDSADSNNKKRVQIANLPGLTNPLTVDLDLDGNCLIMDVDGNSLICGDVDDQIRFQTNASNRVFINNNGLGVGVAPPASTSFIVNRDDTTLVTCWIENNDNAAGQTIGQIGFRALDDGAASTEYVTITGGIASALSPNEDGRLALRVASLGSLQDAYVIDQNLNRHVWSTNTTELMRLNDTDSGRLGIGEPSPQGVLHIRNQSATIAASQYIENDRTTPGDIGYIIWRAQDDATNPTQYVNLRARANTTTNGSEEGQFEIWVTDGASMDQLYRVDPDNHQWDTHNLSQAEMQLNDAGLTVVSNKGISYSLGQGPLRSNQNDTVGAQPCLELDQKDVSEEFIEFIGSAAAATLTQSIVAEGDVKKFRHRGYIKVRVQDDGNQITDQVYYMPIGTLT